MSIADLWALYEHGDAGFVAFVRMATEIKLDEVREARGA